MTSLASLENDQALKAFVTRIATNTMELKTEAVSVNGGITTTAELNAHLKRGRNIEFDFSRLIEESRGYR